MTVVHCRELLQKFWQKGNEGLTMEVELMKLDTSPDGDKKVQILGSGD